VADLDGATMRVTKGNGTAVHIAKAFSLAASAWVDPELCPDGNLSTACDHWGARGAYSSRIRPTTLEVTCKTCLKKEERP